MFYSFEQAFNQSGPYVRMVVEIVKSIKWFLLIMFISVLAAWNAFTLLLKRRCVDSVSDDACEMPRDATSVFLTVYDMINTLLFAQTDLNWFQLSDYFPIVAVIFVISMLAMPIVMINMLIAIMGDSYQVIQVRIVHYFITQILGGGKNIDAALLPPRCCRTED